MNIAIHSQGKRPESHGRSKQAHAATVNASLQVLRVKNSACAERVEEKSLRKDKRETKQIGLE